MKKNKFTKVGIIILVLIGAFQYNGMVVLRNSVKTAWSKVESSYQRRNDLIGNLVKTVQGAADFEKSTLTEVINARAKSTQTNIDANSITPENIAQFQQAQTGLKGALSKLLVSVERYPDLKANKNFLELQSQLEGTENRINVARDRYNDEVNKYANKIEKIPGVIFAKIFGFKDMPRFKSEEGSEKAVDVNFKF